ncbi:MAG TPA: hypothetical protein VNG33_20105 [Polyangiaceae bacterium]|nr:hypothetical protein [Polyangiaceae bacterium]
MSGSAEKPLVSLEVSFGEPPPQGMVTPLCQSLLELCRPAFADDDAATRLRLAAHELLENIVKYSSQGGCELRFALHRNAAGGLEATVQTRNLPRKENRADAEVRLAALTAARDPLEHYDSIIADSARQPAGSGLGLARIHAETEYRLSHRFEGDALLIIASGEVWLKKGALP